MADELFDSLAPCPNPIKACPHENLFFDWKHGGNREVRIACRCGVAGPYYERENSIVACTVAAEAWALIPRPAKISDDQLALYRKTLARGSRFGGDPVWNDGNIRELLGHIHALTQEQQR